MWILLECQKKTGKEPLGKCCVSAVPSGGIKSSQMWKYSEVLGQLKSDQKQYSLCSEHSLRGKKSHDVTVHMLYSTQSYILNTNLFYIVKYKHLLKGLKHIDHVLFSGWVVSSRTFIYISYVFKILWQNWTNLEQSRGQREKSQNKRNTVEGSFWILNVWDHC